ncbi:reverse transcriptase domain-containing protein [Tanacetum coccineum]
MSLELADSSIQYPRGIVENVLIKVDKFVLPIDFVILDMREDSKIPIILGRPFLATARAMIDAFNKKITLKIGDEEVIFDVDQTIKKTHTKDDECYGINDFDQTIHLEAQGLLEDNRTDSFLLKDLENTSTKPIRKYESGKIRNKHLCSASANEIDKKKPELKDLPSHLEYAYLKGDKTHPVIIASKLTKKEKVSLLQVLEKHKGAIAWKMSDIKGISPSFCTHKILMEESFKSVIQPQRRLNPKVQDVVKNKIVRLLDSGLICPIPDRPWVSPIHVIPKKGGITVVLNDNNELIPSRTVTGWRIPIAPEDQEKTTFTCPYGTFAYRRMPFGLCNAPATFQRCMTTIFHDMVEDFMEVFMDDFSVFGNSFNHCLSNLDKMLARCEETNLVLNWEKCHFMVKEGIVLGHKIFEKGIEVDKAKIDVIAKLPYPTNLKGVMSFLGHAGFYRRFIKDFSMISKPMTHLLMKDAKFDFSDECKKAFNNLKEKLTTAPIIISPDWNVPLRINVRRHKHDAKPRLIRWVLLLQRFNIEIKDKKGAENLAADHLSRLENPNMRILSEKEIADKFPYEHLMVLKSTPEDDEPWTAYKTPTGCTPFRLVYGKACHFPIEIEHKAYWALKQCNMDLTTAAKNHFMALNELMELRDWAYENTRIYKEKTKKWHDSRIRKDKSFKTRDKVLLSNSRFRLYPGKLISKWSGSFTVKTVYPYGAVEITDKNNFSFKVNGHKLKKYNDGYINTKGNKLVELDETTG